MSKSSSLSFLLAVFFTASSSSSSSLCLPSDLKSSLNSLYLRAFHSKHNTTGKDQTTTPGTPCPTLYDKRVGSFTSSADHNTEDAGDGAHGLSSLSEKTRISNHLQMLLQRRHILLSYFKTLHEISNEMCWVILNSFRQSVVFFSRHLFLFSLGGSNSDKQSRHWDSGLHSYCT